MKINELDRNLIKKQAANLFLKKFKKSAYKGQLPISIGNFDVVFKPYVWQIYKGILIAVWDADTLVANMFITPTNYNGIKCYYVKFTAISLAYQGQNIGYELYRGLIVLVGIPLITDGSHSPGARKLWLKLCQDPQVTGYGFDLDKNLIFYLQPNKHSTELISADKKIKLYDNDGTGIILVIKNGPWARKLDKLRRETQIAKGIFDRDVYRSKYVKSKPDIFGVNKFPTI